MGRMVLEVVHKTSKQRMSNFDTSERQTITILAKRILDFLMASVMLVILAPLLVVIGAIVKLDSPGPAIFKQVRIGKGGRPFIMYKFRTMKNGDNTAAHRDFIRSLYSEDHSNGQDSLYKVADNGSVTHTGMILRKSSLDELPQLVNVLKGEMSLVGPRPDLPYSVELYSKHHYRRLLVLPGITGLWQVSGRSNRSLLEMLDLDVEYVNKWSFWLDIKILAKTIIAVITGQGAS